MRTETEIRARLAELKESEQTFSWTDGERAVHAKTTIRAQMKGILYSLGEDAGFRIVE
jgi:hypothetical protein